MKKLIPLIAVATMLFACKNKEEKIKESMLPLITDIVKQDSLIHVIDSLVIFKIDTLTELDIENRKMNKPRREIVMYQDLSDNSLQLAKLSMSQAKSSLTQRDLYRETFGYGALSESANESAKRYSEEANQEIKKSQLYSDSGTACIKLLEDFQKRRKAGKIDSIRFKGYIARFRLKGADSKNSAVKMDSMYVFFNENLRVIKGY